MYVRTKYDGIDKFNYKIKNHEGNYYHYYFDKETMTNPEYYVVGKPSFDVIDLVQVGDYINGKKVTEKHLQTENYECDDFYAIFFEKELTGICEEDIKSIVTKEVFQANEYRVEAN